MLRQPAVLRAHRQLDDVETDAGAGEHLDQCVDGEAIDPTTNDVRDPRLGDTEHSRRRHLRQAAAADDFRDDRHQARAEQQVLGFGGWKAQVQIDIATRAFENDSVRSDRLSCALR